ncbi:MAG: 2-oxoacid:acceptor oxidoreductase family protein [Candidatus Krumholzibacteriota bacterium]|nr:2-oxoacid:acceptor oxidoreductase family protein [Candidatus Krumholzibacteriota bacterium]
MKPLNITLSGVGGQGIGLLAEVLARACLAAGHTVHGCDTHGLAQRGGIVVSQLRLGERFHTPRVPPGEADLVIALERLEAARAAATMLAEGGTVIYYDTVQQPIHVRMGEADYPDHARLEKAVAARKGRLERVHLEDLADARMQNVALLGRLAAVGAVEGVTSAVVRQALREVVPARALDANLEVFDKAGI